MGCLLFSTGTFGQWTPAGTGAIGAEGEPPPNFTVMGPKIGTGENNLHHFSELIFGTGLKLETGNGPSGCQWILTASGHVRVGQTGCTGIGKPDISCTGLESGCLIMDTGIFMEFRDNEQGGKDAHLFGPKIGSGTGDLRHFDALVIGSGLRL